MAKSRGKLAAIASIIVAIGTHIKEQSASRILRWEIAHLLDLFPQAITYLAPHELDLIHDIGAIPLVQNDALRERLYNAVRAKDE